MLFRSGHNLKFDLAIAKNRFGIKHKKNLFDSMLLAWLYDSGEGVGLNRQMKKWFDHEMIKFGDVVKKGENFSHIDIESATKYAAEDAVATYRLFYHYENLFSKNGLNHLLNIASKIEYPFIDVLKNMENRGIRVDIDFLGKLKEESSKKISSLTSKIYQLTESEFNINSTQQLGVVLFERLKLPSGKKTKSGYSTDESVLEGLKDSHPVIVELLDRKSVV